MVSANIYLHNLNEFKVYVNKFVDEYFLTIQIPNGAVSFTSNNLKDIESLLKKMLAVVKQEQLLPKKEEELV
ncbi:hypothetical protein THYS13_15110 [Thermoanaerobacter sp. YS13]|uniref:hypothetical protein n=1 Tax=Thermoanaerobacter sp. YS13 TaxID=1511746 RepID=UPI0005743510|nr:hypothetical protein [Thermoanaerobacter sp. YS13]KHO63385.1 hypothetical protein THYS13_15110 [Thermoanaerobacter sp. YS13]